MSVVALMRCNSVALMGWATQVKLTPVIPAEDDPHYDEIKAFHAATPSGEFTAMIANERAAEQFSPGAAFYVSFERAPQHDLTFTASGA